MRKTFLLVGVVCLLLIMPPVVAAEGPVHVHYQFAGSDLLSCEVAPFDGEADYQVLGKFTGQYTVQESDGGAVARVTSVFHGTITNLTDGQVVNHRVARSEVYTFDFSNAPDVLVTISGNGNNDTVVLRGGGPVQINAGKYTLLFDATNPESWVLLDIDIQGGHFDLEPWDLCSAAGDGVFLEYIDGSYEVTKVLQ